LSPLWTDINKMKRRAHDKFGFTLIEALILMVLVSIVAVGVGVGLQSTAHFAEANDTALALSAELNGEAEYWRATAWTTAAWPATLPYSVNDTVKVSVGGQTPTYNRSTTIQNWDPNNMTTNATPQADFVQVQITVNNRIVTFYLTKPN